MYSRLKTRQDTTPGGARRGCGLAECVCVKGRVEAGGLIQQVEDQAGHHACKQASGRRVYQGERACGSREICEYKGWGWRAGAAGRRQEETPVKGSKITCGLGRFVQKGHAYVGLHGWCSRPKSWQGAPGRRVADAVQDVGKMSLIQ